MIKDNLFGIGEVIFNFNEKNVRISVKKSSAYVGGYELIVRANCSNDKLKEVAKLEKKNSSNKKACISHYDPAFSQLRFFLLTQGIDTARLGLPSRDMDKRASKGVKGISLRYHFMDAFYAYALGLDLDSFYGSFPVKTKEEITNREEHARRVFEELKNLQFDNNMKANQEAQITLQNSNEIWKKKFQADWIKALDKAKKQGIAFHVLAA